MGIIAKINLYEQPEQYVLTIRNMINFNDYPIVAGQAYQKIMDYAAKEELLLSGGPFVCYHNVDLEHLDVEMGFPIAKKVIGADDIVGNTIPAQKVVSGIFLGPYGDSDRLMEEMMQWIKEHNLEQKEQIYHYYLNDGDRPESEFLTRIVIPIK